MLRLIPTFLDVFTGLAYVLLDFLRAALQFFRRATRVPAHLAGGGIVPLVVAVTRCQYHPGRKHDK